MQPVKRLLVISDVHGQIDSFHALLEKIDFEPDQDLLFLLGDYVDRGSDPKACVKEVRLLERQGAIILKGNHEEMMEKALTEQTPESIAHWAANGGDETLRSYGVAIKELYRKAAAGESFTISEELKSDLEWISQLNLYAQTDHYLFVHAGINPERSLEEQEEQDLLWIREPFFSGYTGERTVIFGHTPTLNLHKTFDVYFGSNNIIGIDGGAVFGGQLNCLELPSKATWSVR
ncbi:metallophosphoesterase family protein [Sporolactobacillus spathodeae]